MNRSLYQVARARYGSGGSRDGQPPEAAQRDQDILGQRGRDSSFLCIAADDRERQNGDRWPMNQGRWRRGRRCLVGRSEALFDADDKAESVSRKRADHALRPTVIANRLADGVDSRRQRRIGDGPALPDGLEQLVLAYHTVAMAEQVEQDVEDLRLELDLDAFPA